MLRDEVHVKGYLINARTLTMQVQEQKRQTETIVQGSSFKSIVYFLDFII